MVMSLQDLSKVFHISINNWEILSKQTSIRGYMKALSKSGSFLQNKGEVTRKNLYRQLINLTFFPDLGNTFFLMQSQKSKNRGLESETVECRLEESVRNLTGKVSATVIVRKVALKRKKKNLTKACIVNATNVIHHPPKKKKKFNTNIAISVIQRRSLPVRLKRLVRR